MRHNGIRNEFWLVSPSYPNLEVSNTGKVRVKESDKPSNIGKHLKQRTDKDGYKLIAVKKTTIRVHRLVAEAFIPNPNNLPVVNHKDNVKGNNDASNLEWATISYNTSHAYHLKVLSSPLAKYVKVEIDGKLFSYYDSCNKCAKSLKVSSGLVEKCVNRGEKLFGFVDITEVKYVPENSVTDREFNYYKETPSRVNPHLILYNCGRKIMVGNVKEFADILGLDRSSAYDILIRGLRHEYHNIKEVIKMPAEMYYRSIINW